MAVGLPLIAAGTVLSAGAQLSAGKKRAKRGRIQRAINEVAAGQTIATGQRVSLEQKRQAELMASRAVAVAAAGGAAQDIDNLIADIHGEGAYRANVAMYEAETEAENLKFQGLMAEQTGREAEKASQFGALATVISGGGKMAAYK